MDCIKYLKYPYNTSATLNTLYNSIYLFIIDYLAMSNRYFSFNTGGSIILSNHDKP